MGSSRPPFSESLAKPQSELHLADATRWLCPCTDPGLVSGLRALRLGALMKRLSPIVVFLCLATNASADPHRIGHVLTATPRAVGRTVENMVTFRDYRLAINQWILMAGVLFDAKTSYDLTRRCPTPCENYGSVWGAHPSEIRVFTTLGVTGIFYSTLQEVAWEVSYLEPNPAARTFERYSLLFPAVVHATLAVNNTHVVWQPPEPITLPPGFNANADHLSAH